MRILLGYFFGVLVITGVLIVGSDAAPFTSRSQLKTAVDNCLAVDATGVTCCATADCGPAGSDEMKDWDVGQVTDMSGLFWYDSHSNVFNVDISGWDVSSVTDMNNMFSEATAFNADISGWDTSSVMDMGNMFWQAEAFEADISGWDTSSVRTMRSMFDTASAFNVDISGWDVSSVTDMRACFDLHRRLMRTSRAGT